MATYQGAATSSWKVPDSAKLGNYEIVLSGGKRGEQYTGEFRVADFRLPVFTGSVQGVPARQVAPDKVPLALSLSFLNGHHPKHNDNYKDQKYNQSDDIQCTNSKILIHLTDC